MEHDKSPSLDGLHDSRKHRATTIGGLRWCSFWLQLLGIFVLAQQFTLASAEGMCQVFDRVMKRFDLIGLISAFGPAAATKSLSYSALNDNSYYLTGHIGPGSLRVAASLLQATGFRLARLLSFAGTGNECSLVQLDCPQSLHYIGLKSNTECPVANAVGASIIQEHQALWEEKVKKCRRSMEQETDEKGKRQKNEEAKLGRAVGRNSKRDLTLIILEVGRTKEKIHSKENINPSERRNAKEDAPALQNVEDSSISQAKAEESPVSLTAAKGGALLLGWLPLMLTLGVVGSCIHCKQWLIGWLIMLGTFGMTIAVVGLRLCHFKYSEVETAPGAPEGDCVVVNDTDGKVLHIIIGKEEIIQVLFQRKIEFKASVGKYVLFFAGLLLYVYVIESVLYMPSVSAGGQLHYLVANMIGFVADVVKGSKNGMLGLATRACKQFDIVLKDYIVFRNRTAAVACVAGHADDRSTLKTRGLLPCEGAVWQIWWDKLPQFVGVVEEAAIANVDAGLKAPEKELLRALLSDMRTGLTESLRGSNYRII